MKVCQFQVFTSIITLWWTQQKNGEYEVMAQCFHVNKVMLIDRHYRDLLKNSSWEVQCEQLGQGVPEKTICRTVRQKEDRSLTATGEVGLRINSCGRGRLQKRDRGIRQKATAGDLLNNKNSWILTDCVIESMILQRVELGGIYSI